MDVVTQMSMQFLKWVTEVAVRIDETIVSTTTKLEAEIEEKLRQAGIPVVLPDASRRVTLRVSCTRIPLVADANQSSLDTAVTLTAWLVPMCGSYQASETRVWWVRRSQVVNNTELDIRLRQDIDSLVDEFVAAYRLARRRK